jgi:hypothetical protein
MDDIANLGIRVDSRSVRTADKDLDKLSKASGRAERATDSLKRSYAAATASILASAAAFGGTVNKLVQIERQTGILTSSLRTVTGSATLAGDAFDALAGLAGRLPVSIPEITDAFIKMKALGLNPTESALISFTNTASAMGKNLNQFIEAVADASTMEFERLKEFGIKARSEADAIAFTFQGTTTRVGKNADAITGYLQNIGNTTFAGAATARMAELDGQISNLSDTWDTLFRTINEKGAAKVISSTVKTATEAVQELNDLLGSGQMGGGLDNIGKMFSESFDVSRVTDAVRTEFGSTFEAIGFAGSATVDFLVGAFARWPRNVAAVTKLIGVEIANLVALAGVYGEKLAFYLDTKNWFNDEPAEKLEAATSRLTRKTEELNRALKNGAIEAAPAIIKLRKQIADLAAEQELYTNQIETGTGKLDELAAKEAALSTIRQQSIDDILVSLADQLKLDEQRATQLDVLRKKYDESKTSAKSLDDVLKQIPRSTDAIITKTGQLTDRIEQVADVIPALGAPVGVATGEEFSDGFGQGAERIATTLQDSIARGDWSGLGMTVAGAFAGGVGGVVADQLAQQLGAGDSAAIIGPIGGAIAGGLIGLAANAIADFFRDDWDPTESLQAAQGTGSVLGSINAKSESISKATEAIEKTNADLVNINLGMLAALQSLQQGISGATAMIAGGRPGFQTPGVEGNFFTSGGLGAGVAGGVAGSALGGLLTGGIGAALGAISGSLGNVASDFMNTITLGLFGALGRALGGKSRQVDEGIDIVGGTLADLIDETIVSAYATFRVKKNAFSSTKTVEQSRLLAGEITNQFSRVFEDIMSAVVQGGMALGVDQASLEQQLGGFVVENQRLSLEGLDAAAQQAEIQAVFSKLFDDMTLAVVPYLAQMQLAGEGLGETLARVATQYSLAREAVTVLGLSINGAFGSETLVQAADDLVRQAGGIQAFSSAIGVFETNFLSAEQQFSNAGRRLTEAFTSMGVELPATRAEFVALVHSLDPMNDANRALLASLTGLFGPLDAYYDTLEDAVPVVVEATQTLEEFWTSISGGVASFVDKFAPEAVKFDMLTRDMTDALASVGLTLPATRDDMWALGLSLDASTASGMAAISALAGLSSELDRYYTAIENIVPVVIEVAQTLEEFWASISGGVASFVDKFAPEAHKFETLTRDVTTALNGVGLAVPATREGMWALATGLDATTEAGRAAITAIANASGNLDSYYTTLESGAEKLKTAAAGIFADLQRAADTSLSNLRAGTNAQVSALQTQKDIYTSGLSTATDTTDGLMSQLVGIVDVQKDAAADKLRAEQNIINAERADRIKAASDRLSAQRNAIQDEMDLRLEANGLMLDAAKSMVSELGQELGGISGALKNLAGEISPTAVWGQSMATLRNALATGNLAGAGEAAGVAANVDSSRFSSATDLRRVQGSTANLLAQLESAGQGQLSIAEQTVANLTAQTDVIKTSSNAQVAAAERSASRSIAAAEKVAQDRLDAAQEQHDTEVDRLNKLITDAQEYIRVSRGIEAGVKTVDEAIRAGLASLKLEAENRGALEQGKFDEQIDSLNNIYDTAQDQLNVLRGIDSGIGDIAGLKRSFDAAIEAERAALVAQGVSVPAFASGGSHSGGVRVVGENGPELEFTGSSRIMSNGDSRSLLDFDSMVSELRALRDELRAGQITIAKNTNKTAKQLERWDLQGLPEERVFT